MTAAAATPVVIRVIVVVVLIALIVRLLIGFLVKMLIFVLSNLLLFLNKTVHRTVMVFYVGHWSFRILIFTEVGA